MAENESIISDADRKNFARLVAQSWSDPDLEARYHADPKGTLSEFGIQLGEDVPTPALPTRPEGEFSVEQLESVAGGFGCLGTASCPAACFGCYGCA